jgi:hypothetical protein
LFAIQPPVTDKCIEFIARVLHIRIASTLTQIDPPSG